MSEREALIASGKYRDERGLLWPAYDEKCAAVVFKMAKDLDHVLPMLKNKRVCIQAGGNCGVWPRVLAPLFSQVLTFEPDPMNYVALKHNVADFPNVTPFNVALGTEAGFVDMFTPSHETDNCGALQVDVKPFGTVPMISIDSLYVSAIDMIYLDIEGFEIPALRGAARTIRENRPLVVIEDKGLSERYGHKQGDADRVMADFGYKVAKRMHRDVVYSPR
jgi:FkbM family methyltransferase